MALACNTGTSNQNNILWSRKQVRRPLAGTTKKEISLYQKTIRAGLPVLTWKEIRRYRLPFHEVITIEMEEEGLIKSADYIKKLFDLDDSIRETAGPETNIWNRPRLKNQFFYLEEIRIGLGAAEKAKQERNLDAESHALLQLAIFFMTRSEDWWWIAEQLFLKCVEVGHRYRADGGRREAIIRYCYGLMLLEQLDRPKEAYELLQEARELSRGHVWNAEKELGRPMESLYVETCCLLSSTLLSLSQEIRSEFPEQAIRYCNLAVRRAVEAGHPELELAALLELGSCQADANDYVTAVETLTQYLERSGTCEDMTNVCYAHLELAFCYRALGDTDLTLQHLENFKDVAELNSLRNELGAAERYLGEYYLTMELPDEALNHLLSSFSIFHQMGTLDEMELTRVLAAIAMGQTFMPVLADHILMCGYEYSEFAQKKILRWKMAHTPFWQLSEDSSFEDEEKSAELET